ncbi:hypothetical protein Ae201684_008447 [Aphanomyces euteiches]|uniref:RNA polymerase II subunit A C-terminal domain phosphatase n=1 Tax=Aphanomyces euteiches TaxID=100861 RepID=A0A6G0X4V7_9STRA|nr:hypothetical protein Ae201684_008447 [Aphanomyces euteiches]
MATNTLIRLRCATQLDVQWRLSDGVVVKEGDVLAELMTLEKTTSTVLASPVYGTLKILQERQNESNGEVDVGYIIVCQHDLVRDNLCLMCMYKFEDGARHTVKVILNDGQAMHVSENQAKQMDNDNIARMLKNAKLTLVLDLDHTLLHAVRHEDLIDPVENYKDIIHFEIPGIPTPHVLKLRPGLSTFLNELSSKYEMWIYTHGTRQYAEKIAEIIDPNQTYFGGRIVSRSDTPDIGHKSLKLLFPSCDDSMIIVLDDRIDVWKENYENVFIIEAYRYFNTRAEINNASGKSGQSDGTKEDAHLTKACRVLKNAHERFFLPGGALDVETQRSGRGRSVKKIMLNLRHEVFKGCNIVFSGVIPQHKPPETDYLWKLALSFGARPSLTLDDFPITHLIIDPRRLGSKKYMEAKEKGNVLMIEPQWLVDSASEWMRLDEAKYAISTSRKTPEVETKEPIEEGQQEEESKKEETPIAPVISQVKQNKQPIKGILASPQTGGQQPKKSVRFVEEEKPAASKPQFGNLPKSRVAVKNGPRPAIITPKGVVASGGSLEFVSKISQLKSRAVVPPRFNRVVAQQEAPRAASPDPPRDVDDIFSKYEAAEEEEEKQLQPKRKSELFQERSKKKQKETIQEPDDEDDDAVDDLDDELFNDT